MACPKVAPARLSAQVLAGFGEGFPKISPGHLVRRIWQVLANVSTKVPPARFGAQGLAGSGNGSDKGSLVRFGAQGLAGSGECSHQGVRFCA